MTRFYGLVLVPNTPSLEEACNIAAKLLYLHQYSDTDPEQEYKFDWFLQPDDLLEEGDADNSRGNKQFVWRVSEILGQFASLEVEAIVTPDGHWHDMEPSHMWDEPAWVQRARQLLQQHQDCIALKHVLHI